jgi:hypothetical protein
MGIFVKWQIRQRIRAENFVIFGGLALWGAVFMLPWRLFKSPENRFESIRNG